VLLPGYHAISGQQGTQMGSFEASDAGSGQQQVSGNGGLTGHGGGQPPVSDTASRRVGTRYLEGAARVCRGDALRKRMVMED